MQQDSVKEVSLKVFRLLHTVDDHIASLSYRTDTTVKNATKDYYKNLEKYETEGLSKKWALKERVKGKSLRKNLSYVIKKSHQQGGICPYCKKNLIAEEENGNEITIDHIIPIALGGCSTFENTVLCDRICNEKKASMLPDAFVKKELSEGTLFAKN